nr:uncharacterized protein LOC127328735 [Lolium perenne]
MDASPLRPCRPWPRRPPRRPWPRRPPAARGRAARPAARLARRPPRRLVAPAPTPAPAAHPHVAAVGAGGGVRGITSCRPSAPHRPSLPPPPRRGRTTRTSPETDEGVLRWSSCRQGQGGLLPGAEEGRGQEEGNGELPAPAAVPPAPEVPPAPPPCRPPRPPCPSWTCSMRWRWTSTLHRLIPIGMMIWREEMRRRRMMMMKTSQRYKRRRSPASARRTTPTRKIYSWFELGRRWGWMRAPCIDQTGKRYWQRIEDAYLKMKPKRSGFASRSFRSLQGRWDLMKPACARWSAAMDQVMDAPPSGTVESDYEKIAGLRYKEMAGSKGKEFPFKHVWSILQTYDKWKLRDDETASKKSAMLDMDDPEVEERNLNKPEGTKKAKLRGEDGRRGG